MTAFDPRMFLDTQDINVKQETCLSTTSSNEASPNSTFQPDHLPSSFYNLPYETLDLSMYDPNLLPDSFFNDMYIPTDPLYLDGLDTLPELLHKSDSKTSTTPSSEHFDAYDFSTIPSQNDNSAIESPLEVATEGDKSIDHTKRQRVDLSDSKTACWTSPLCPNNKDGGSTPNPSSCGGECAPFLFSERTFTEPDPTINTSFLDIDISAESDYSPVEEPKENHKRRETSSTEKHKTRIGGRQQKAATGTRASTRKSTSIEQDTPIESIEGTTDLKNKKRIPHNEVERKYRDSVNNQMECLQRVVPVLQPTSRICDGADIEDLPVPSKPSKAVILASATSYIKQLEREKKEQKEQNELLQARVKALQTLVKCDDCSLMQYVKNMSIRGGLVT
ncbi:hypothetical protein EJ08DRAFT_645594 [Tothia fuscella]|uniref:BHLH domain-containing protein n=1 Tax=Tothia fuscella TaxID=1048955 RepID=A0A9P4P0G9_9PEZI|nr:hypothetical protein EJ08DRAFT_645594 [Tothia fuscella]